MDSRIRYVIQSQGRYFKQTIPITRIVEPLRVYNYGKPTPVQEPKRVLTGQYIPDFTPMIREAKKFKTRRDAERCVEHLIRHFSRIMTFKIIPAP